QVLGPQGASLDYMTGVDNQIVRALQAEPEVQDTFAVAGFNFTGNGANRAVVFASLTPIAERKAYRHSAMALVQRLQGKLLGGITGALAIPFLPPAIQGVGNTGGFTFEVLDKSGSLDIAPLGRAAEGLTGAAMQGGRVSGLFSTFSNDDPQLRVSID